MEIWSLLERKEVWQEADDLGVGTTREQVCDMEQALNAIEHLFKEKHKAAAVSPDIVGGKELINLRARLLECVKRKCAYHAHLIQDAWQGGYRQDVLSKLKRDRCYDTAYACLQVPCAPRGSRPATRQKKTCS
jgi:hypothetical protein